jgi:hypothetical protein
MGFPGMFHRKETWSRPLNLDPEVRHQQVHGGL